MSREPLKSYLRCQRFVENRLKMLMYCVYTAAVLMSGVAGAPVMAQGVFIDGEQFRDPTRPAHMAGVGAEQPSDVWQTPEQTQYTVSFIRTGGESAIAVINNQSVRIGERIGDAIVRDIRPTEVTLLVGGRELILSTISLPVRKSVN